VAISEQVFISALLFFILSLTPELSTTSRRNAIGGGVSWRRRRSTRHWGSSAASTTAVSRAASALFANSRGSYQELRTDLVELSLDKEGRSAAAQNAEASGPKKRSEKQRKKKKSRVGSFAGEQQEMTAAEKYRVNGKEAQRNSLGRKGGRASSYSSTRTASYRSTNNSKLI
jgi:hypothetical protein